MSDMSNRAAAAASQCGECGDRFRAEVRALRSRAEKAEAVADALAKALEGYQKANRIHNDSESDLFDAGEAALAAYREGRHG